MTESPSGREHDQSGTPIAPLRGAQDVVITSRIFAPEPSAASFRLRALAQGFAEAGAHVQVLTSQVPEQYRAQDVHLPENVSVKRAPVLRDSEGYVRGYLQYMSFDIPLFFRLLFRKRPTLVVTEPPPTTGFFVRVACAIRRVPYAYYAADVWADAVGAVETPNLVARVVRGLEMFALRGAKVVLSVSKGVTNRLAELGVTENVVTIGNGVDLSAFPENGARQKLDGPYFLYAGTASEVHGASVFLEAFLHVYEVRPDARLVFLGQGSEREQIEKRAMALPAGAVVFMPRAEPETVAEWLRGAVASLASVVPGQGYDFAFPTKLYASAAVGTPAIYAGSGPGEVFVSEHRAGYAVGYSAEAVSHAMLSALEANGTPFAEQERTRIASWAHATLGLEHVAAIAVAQTLPAQSTS